MIARDQLGGVQHASRLQGLEARVSTRRAPGVAWTTRTRNRRHDLRPKDLRHTVGTALTRATGGNVATVHTFLKHATSFMSEPYRMAAVPLTARAPADPGVLDLLRIRNPGLIGLVQQRDSAL